jgi:hypothetical protein
VAISYATPLSARQLFGNQQPSPQIGEKFGATTSRGRGAATLVVGPVALWRVRGQNGFEMFELLVLAEGVLFLHLVWCAWVVAGWAVTRRRRLVRRLHIASLVYAIFIELTPWPPCPLTVAEAWLETRAGIQPERGPFLMRVLEGIVYPDLPEWIVVGCAVMACVLLLAVYVRRYRRRAPDGVW